MMEQRRPGELKASVVIPTYNRLGQLCRVLAGLQRQRAADPFEVIVVSDGSTDGTDEYLASTAPPVALRFHRQLNAGPAAARNRGVAMARSDLVIFLDDDVVPPPSFLAEHIGAHAREGPDAVVLGPMLTPPDFDMSPWVYYEQQMLRKQYDAMTGGCWAPTPRQFYTGNASLRRVHIIEAGGFDESFVRAEDVEFAYRLAALGLRFVYVPEAYGQHYAERTYASWLNNAYSYGRSDVIMARDHGQAWLLSAMEREFRDRRLLIRGVVRLCVDRDPIRRMAAHSLSLLAAAAPGSRRIAQAALSATYNLSYYQGVADEMHVRASINDASLPVDSRGRHALPVRRGVARSKQGHAQ